MNILAYLKNPDMWNLFKNKKQIHTPGNYDWTFQFVNGGFAVNNNLRKDKSYKAIVWLGGFKLRLINVRKGNETTFFKSDEDLQYKTSVRFPYNPDLLVDKTIPGIISNCSHDWVVTFHRNELSRETEMICTICKESHKVKVND